MNHLTYRGRPKVTALPDGANSPSEPERRTFAGQPSDQPGPALPSKCSALPSGFGPSHAQLCLLLLASLLNLAAAQDFRVPYSGPSHPGIDPSTLTGKVMCGYQGWFDCEGDGAELGWVHWGRRGNRPPGPDNVSVDLWPDVSEYSAAERYPTGFRHADGSVAEVFSSYNRETVLRHWQWMRDYGIDGAFVQRFANGVTSEKHRRQKDAVLAHCREGANLNGRTYAVMYDLSGVREGRMGEVMNDWRALQAQMRITSDPAYLHHKGKPLVAVWGVGFNDGRRYTLEECRQLVDFLKNDPEAGGCAVMLGVPTGWRELNRDAVNDPKLHEIIKLADVVSPWTVGRFGTTRDVARHGSRVEVPDIAWCADSGLDYLPVVFPGFSWHHLKAGAPLNQIPRQKGQFLWSQMFAAKQAGANMIYVAMFDEVDEGTAIFKCANDVPVGPGAEFLSYEGVPADHYLWLTGMGGRMLRGELPASESVPERVGK